MSQQFDVLILGAGAAGLFCAAEAAKRGRRVALIECADRAGKKILISGGGRCNFTNLYCGPDNFLSDNPHFAKSALARFTPTDFISRVAKHGIPYHEKTLGQLFCDRAATDITGMLESECRAGGVKLFLNTRISEVSRTTQFNVRTESMGQSDDLIGTSLVVATGGLSIPKMGATSFGYDLARQFGLKIVPTRPALVPLLFSRADLRTYSELAGVSAEVIASLADSDATTPAFREKMLFTHRGLSGPAILQISSYWSARKPIQIDLAPELNVTLSLRAATARDAAAARKILQQFLPKRLATQWLDSHLPPSWNNAGLDALEKQIHAWNITPSGTEGYEKAEVTAGGVDTRDLSSKTMAAREVPGLFFIGEVVDVTGHLGGFNFQWAWASAYAAAQAI